MYYFYLDQKRFYQWTTFLSFSRLLTFRNSLSWWSYPISSISITSGISEALASPVWLSQNSVVHPSHNFSSFNNKYHTAIPLRLPDFSLTNTRKKSQSDTIQNKELKNSYGAAQSACFLSPFCYYLQISTLICHFHNFTIRHTSWKVFQTKDKLMFNIIC